MVIQCAYQNQNLEYRPHPRQYRPHHPRQLFVSHQDILWVECGVESLRYVIHVIHYLIIHGLQMASNGVNKYNKH